MKKRTSSSDFSDNEFRRKKKKFKEEHIRLGWKIIEHKLMYYYPELVRREHHNKLTITDEEYDQLEIRYLKICRKFGFENTVVHKDYGIRTKGTGMQELDFTRPSVLLVVQKYGGRHWEKKLQEVL